MIFNDKLAVSPLTPAAGLWPVRHQPSARGGLTGLLPVDMYPGLRARLKLAYSC